MKIQAWGWLTAAVLAAGLNSSYHNGGLQWAHEVVDRVQHNSNAVLALATGRADRFLAEARLVRPRQEKCPLAAALADAQNSFREQQDWQLEQVQVMSDQEQARLVRFAANRARLEARVQSRLARIHVDPVVVQIPKIDCPRVRVNIPRTPRFQVPAPTVQVKYSGPGPV